MAIWQWGLLLLAGAMAIQAFGVWRQVCHYSDVFKGARQKYASGYVGTGISRGRFKKGTIVMIIVSPELAVCRLLVMSGRSVFARFERRQEFEGLSLEDVRSNPALLGANDPRAAAAIQMAIEQIDRARGREENTEILEPERLIPGTA